MSSSGGQTPKTRVLLIDMPRILRDILARVIDAQPDMCVVGQERHPSVFQSAVQESEPEFVVVGLEHGDLPVECQISLESGAKPRLIGVELTDGRVFLYRLQPKPERISETSLMPAGVAAAIRIATARAAAE